MRYRATFTGRAARAIGIFHAITTHTEGSTPQQAELALYERYEHIQGLQLTPLDRYTLAELQALPTLSAGHFDNVKIDSNGLRVSLSRMTHEDGAPYDNQVTIERKTPAGWKEVDSYEAR